MIGSCGKLTQEKADIIKELLATGDWTHKQIGQFFGVSREMITKINMGQRWNDDIRSFEMRDNQGPKKSNDFREFTDTPKTRERKPEKTLYRYTNMIGKNEAVNDLTSDLNDILKVNNKDTSDIKSITIHFG